MSTQEKHVSRIGETSLTTGTALAMIISWGIHKSIVLALIHGFLSWFYVIYFAFTR